VLFSRSKGVVGLDLGSSAVKLLEVKERKPGDYHLLRLGIEPLSPEAIVDGSIMDSSLVVDAIHKLNDETRVKATQYATSLSGHSAKENNGRLLTDRSIMSIANPIPSIF
jgi:type IV pilus assembly protein PilM